MKIRIPILFWYFHENSDSFTKLTRNQFETSSECWALHELGPVKQGTEEEARELFSIYVASNRNPYKRYWYTRGWDDEEGFISDDPELHLVNKSLTNLGECLNGTPEEYYSLWKPMFELPF